MQEFIPDRFGDIPALIIAVTGGGLSIAKWFVASYGTRPKIVRLFELIVFWLGAYLVADAAVLSYDERRSTQVLVIGGVGALACSAVWWFEHETILATLRDTRWFGTSWFPRRWHYAFAMCAPVVAALLLGFAASYPQPTELTVLVSNLGDDRQFSIRLNGALEDYEDDASSEIEIRSIDDTVNDADAARRILADRNADMMVFGEVGPRGSEYLLQIVDRDGAVAPDLRETGLVRGNDAALSEEVVLTVRLAAAIAWIDQENFDRALHEIDALVASASNDRQDYALELAYAGYARFCPCPRPQLEDLTRREALAMFDVHHKTGHEGSTNLAWQATYGLALIYAGRDDEATALIDGAVESGSDFGPLHRTTALLTESTDPCRSAAEMERFISWLSERGQTANEESLEVLSATQERCKNVSR
jgi:hypothetical protein